MAENRTTRTTFRAKWLVVVAALGGFLLAGCGKTEPKTERKPPPERINPDTGERIEGD